MIERRPFDTLGGANHGWLDAKHHFSFAGYHDQARMGWGALRVWNDDTIAPRSGFPPHPHADMEIITYVREGAISHRDNLGNEGRTVAGDVQVMSAGTGIAHAEYNMDDEHTLEAEMSRNHDLNSLFAALSSHGITVTSMRNKTNRLEELFVRLVEGGRREPGKEKVA